MGLSMVLTTQDPAELTGQLNSVQNVIDKESVVARPARGVPGPAHRAGAGGRGRQGRGGQGAQGRRREPAAQAGARAQAEAAETAGRATWSTLRADAQQEAENATPGRPGPAARPAEGAQPDRRDPQASAPRRPVAGRWPRPAGRAVRPDPGRRRPDRTPTASWTTRSSAPVTSPFGWRTTRSTATARCTTASTSAPAAAPRSTPPPPARCVEKYFQTAWGNRVIIDHGFHHGVGLATITNHMSGPAIVNAGQHVAPRPGRRVRRHDRLVDRLPPALHGAAERRPGEPDELVLTSRSIPGCPDLRESAAWSSRRGTSSSRRTRRRGTTTSSRTPTRPAWSSRAPR